MNGTAIGEMEPASPPVPEVQERWQSVFGKVASRFSLVMAWTIALLGVGLLSLSMVGFQYISARGDSMEPALYSGSLLVTRQTSPEDVRAGDIVVFPEVSEGNRNIVHRVVALQDDGQRIVAITKGDNNPVPDPEALMLDGPVSRLVLTIPYVGWWFTPFLGWYLLGVGTLLGLKATLSWSAQRKTNRSTKVMPPVRLMDGVADG
jgi:signal peptidase